MQSRNNRRCSGSTQPTNQPGSVNSSRHRTRRGIFRGGGVGGRRGNLAILGPFWSSRMDSGLSSEGILSDFHVFFFHFSNFSPQEWADMENGLNAPADSGNVLVFLCPLLFFSFSFLNIRCFPSLDPLFQQFSNLCLRKHQR